MYGGSVVEEARPTRSSAPRHPYTRRLLEAMPRARGRATGPLGIPGSAVEPWNRPHGCPFAAALRVRDRGVPGRVPARRHDGAAARALLATARRRRPASPGRPRASARGRPPARRSERCLVVRNLIAGYRGRAASRGARDRGRRPRRVVRVAAGRCLAIVGESGSGKTTLARCIAGLHAPSSGDDLLDGAPLARLARSARARARRRSRSSSRTPTARSTRA